MKLADKQVIFTASTSQPLLAAGSVKHNLTVGFSGERGLHSHAVIH